MLCLLPGYGVEGSTEAFDTLPLRNRGHLEGVGLILSVHLDLEVGLRVSALGDAGDVDGFSSLQVQHLFPLLLYLRHGVSDGYTRDGGCERKKQS